MTARGRAILRWAGAAAGLGVAALALLQPFTAWWVRHEERAWGEGQDARSRPTPDATASSLIELARPLGIELRVFRSSDPELSPVVAFVEAQRRAVADDEAAASSAVLVLLGRHGPSLQEIERVLAGAPPPAWPEGFERPSDTPLPPVLGLRALNALLLAHAAERDRVGDALGTERALLASARLGASIEGRAETLAQLGAAAIVGERAGVLRRLAHAPSGWVARLGAHDFRGTFLGSYRMEARLHTAHARDRWFSWRGLAGRGSDPEYSGPFRVADRLLATPYARLCAADCSRRLRGLAAALRAEDPCRVDTMALDDALERDRPRWNVMARTALQHAANRWTAVRDVELDEELTRVVLDTRARPPERPDTVPSRVCGGLVWTRTPDAAGSVTVDPAGVALPARPGGAPWRYRLAPPSAGR